ncbi:MAG: 50S ribosomal protein L29 [Chitinophagaceae bacterium]|nr:50S ribosomal protein L29 [Chitinophagaceae bacterium]
MAKTKKITRNEEIRNMNADELKRQIEEGTTRLQRMMFSHAITPIDNPMAIRTLRRELAKLKTAARTKQMENQ